MSGAVKGMGILNRERAYTDVPVTRGWGNDAYARVNAQYEMLYHKAAPGSSVQTYQGHAHRSDGDGVGIMRCCIGQAAIATPPLQKAVASGDGVVSMGDSPTGGTYHELFAAGEYILGTAQVSPGIELITCDVCIACASASAATEFRVHNLTDDTYTSWIDVVSANPTWYYRDGVAEGVSAMELDVVRTEEDRANFKRIDLDIEVQNSGSSLTFSLYTFFPYEYRSADDGS